MADRRGNPPRMLQCISLISCYFVVCCSEQRRFIDGTRGTADNNDNSNPIQKRFSFAAYYGDHMVLQKAPQRAVIWGYSPYVYEMINVSMDKQTTQVLVDVHGLWRVTLDPVNEPGPYTITARSSVGEITLTDVLFGDVWLCSGQSNMQFTTAQVILIINLM
ncbi:sialate O-acetylesterase-like [Pecten maximus]|uniref:sialate O-acetylesterase-like n=1 Tax=Pecten maximus TaxID=6579 RepID=UPI001458FB8F|nr:sialate O-acetylesterase-like [Pecten maximus]